MSECICVGHLDYGPHECQCGIQIKALECECNRLKAKLDNFIRNEGEILAENDAMAFRVNVVGQENGRLQFRLAIAREALEKINACRGQMAMWNLAEQALQKLSVPDYTSQGQSSGEVAEDEMGGEEK